MSNDKVWCHACNGYVSVIEELTEHSDPNKTEQSFLCRVCLGADIQFIDDDDDDEALEYGSPDFYADY